MAKCGCSTGEWDAWHDRMPGGLATLHVRGSCECPAAGYELELRRHEPQGINRDDLLLDLVEREPSGGAAQVVTPVDVEYREETETSFVSVSILPDGPMGVPVREVS